MTANGTNRAQQWAQSNNETLELPSGRDCVVRPPNALTMIMEDGDVPDFLYANFLQGFQTGNGAVAQQELGAREQLKQTSQFINRVVQRSLVSPKIVDGNPDHEDDEITIDMVEDGDKWHIFGWAMAKVGMEDTEVLKSFLEKQKAGVDAAPDGKNLRKSTK